MSNLGHFVGGGLTYLFFFKAFSFRSKASGYLHAWWPSLRRSLFHMFIDLHFIARDIYIGNYPVIMHNMIKAFLVDYCPPSVMAFLDKSALGCIETTFFIFADLLQRESILLATPKQLAEEHWLFESILLKISPTHIEYYVRRRIIIVFCLPAKGPGWRSPPSTRASPPLLEADTQKSQNCWSLNKYWILKY